MFQFKSRKRRVTTVEKLIDSPLYSQSQRCPVVKKRNNRNNDTSDFLSSLLWEKCSWNQFKLESKAFEAMFPITPETVAGCHSLICPATVNQKYLKIDQRSHHCFNKDSQTQRLCYLSITPLPSYMCSHLL